MGEKYFKICFRGNDSENFASTYLKNLQGWGKKKRDIRKVRPLLIIIAQKIKFSINICTTFIFVISSKLF